MRTIVLVVAIGLFTRLVAQEWHDDGNNGTTPGTNFLGTTDSERLLIKTDDEWRLQLNKSEAYNIGGFAAMPADGFVSISPNNSFWGSAPFGPFSRLHLAEGSGDNVQDHGYRPWMRNGVTVTGNSDLGYMGQKFTYNEPDDHTSGEAEDYTDMVIQWSDNPGKTIKDRMRFIFTSEYNESAYGSGSLEGLEGMRLFPVSGTEVNVGVGDFYAGNLINSANVVEPTDRLDILNGRLRIRDLPEDTETTFDKILVVDDTDPDDDEYGVVKWRSAAELITAASCEWTVQNAGTSGSGVTHNVYSAVGSDDLCPDATDEVGIGTSAPAAKLHVYRDVPSDGTPRVAIHADMKADATSNWHTGISTKAEPASGTGEYIQGVLGDAYNAATHLIGTRGRAYMTTTISGSEVNGVRGETTVSVAGASANLVAGVYGDAVCNGGSVNHNYGMYARGYGGSNAYGAYGLAYATGSTGTAIGVRGDAFYASNLNIGVDAAAYHTSGTKYGLKASATGAGTNYGVYATVPDTSTNNWAGYFNGKVQVLGNMWHGGTFIFSDSELKTDVAEVNAETATNLLSQLSPRTYHYNAAQYPYMNLPMSTQFGFLAQEVEQVLPQLVGSTIVAEVRDTSGNLLAEEMEVKGINYVGLIPLLVAGYQAQAERAEALAEQVADQAERLDALEQALSNCCSNMGGGEQRVAGAGGNMDVVSGNARALTIQPNPFNEQTTLYYTLERSGRMQLMANSADGKQLRVLHEAALEAGQYQHEWQTSDLSPGVYYVTLLLDGEAIVKKAVKVQR